MSRIDIPADAQSVADARHALAADLAAAGATDAVADATLVLSELLSNALKHGSPLTGGRVAVDWDVEDDSAVLIAVTDGGTETEPRAKPEHRTRHGGRGLAIVERLASEWGVRRGADRKTVWARVPLHAGLLHLQ